MVTDNIKDNNMEPVQYVYALSNPSFPDDYIKIGCTINNPVDRAKSMQSTGVPTPFDIMFVILTSDAYLMENVIHKHLDKNRLNDNREFFKISQKALEDVLIKELKLKLTHDIDNLEKDNKNVLVNDVLIKKHKKKNKNVEVKIQHEPKNITGVSYTCERCLCTFNRKSSYDNHLNRKILCQIITQKDDDLKILMTEMNKMKEEIKGQSKQLTEQNNQIKEQSKQLTKQFKQLTEQDNKIKELQKQLDDKNNPVDDEITAFGDEDVSFLTDAMYKTIMDKGESAPCEFINQVHFNDVKPGYQNVFISNKKFKNYIKVYDGSKWIDRMRNEVVHELKITAFESITQKAAALDPENEDDAVTLQNIASFLDGYNNNDTDMLNKFDDTIELMLYNGRIKVKATHGIK